MDLPSEVLPTPGGPTKQRIGPFEHRAQLQDGQIVENAVLDLFQVVMVFVEDFGGARLTSTCEPEELLQGRAAIHSR